jgi:hypothetical protein
VDIPDLGAELDNIELKLDWVTQTLMFIAGRTATPPIGADDPVAVDPDAPVEIGDSSGIIITVSGIPPGVGEDFGTPVRYHKLGRVTLGTPDGWLPSFDLEQNPLVITPIPAGVTRVQVAVRPPATATVILLRPPK